MRTANLIILGAAALTVTATSSFAASSTTSTTVAANPATKKSAADKAAADKAAAAKAVQDDSDSDEDDADETTAPAKGGGKSGGKGVATATRTLVPDDMERPHQSYIYVGARYRGDVLPGFLLNAFVDHAHTLYFNGLGAEVDFRKNGLSLVGGLTYTDFNTGDMLLHEKGKDFHDYNWSVINSSMKMISANLDVLWSVNLAKNIDFEYGVGASLGLVFGNLYDDWAYNAAAPGQISQSGAGLQKCWSTTTNTNGCDPRSHTNPVPNKVGLFTEKSWFNGGPKPSIIPNMSFQPAGLRFRPIPEMEARVNVGLSLTGIWFGVSADYGLPSSSNAKTSASSHPQGSGISW